MLNSDILHELLLKLAKIESPSQTSFYSSKWRVFIQMNIIIDPHIQRIV